MRLKVATLPGPNSGKDHFLPNLGSLIKGELNGRRGGFGGENKLPLGGNTLGFVLEDLLGFVPGRGRELEEEEET